MERHRIENFSKGWVVGNFSPSLHLNSNFEVGFKTFRAGERALAHYQIVATEITIVTSGTIMIGNATFETGDIIVIHPSEVAGFESITDSSLVCIKFPSIPSDKVLVNE
jgi:quercetin dioxygenase-like cupin family protein